MLSLIKLVFLGDLKTPKGHFEINWPLEVDKCVCVEFWTFPTSFAPVDDVVVVVIWWWWFWPRSFHWCFIPSLLILYNILIKSVLSNSWIFRNQIKILLIYIIIFGCFLVEANIFRRVCQIFFKVKPQGRHHSKKVKYVST